MSDPRGPLDARGRALASLRRVYGDHLKPAQRMADAIRAEIPGGGDLMHAVALANETTKWDDATILAVAKAIDSAIAARCEEHDALRGKLASAFSVAGSMPGLDEPKRLSSAHELLRQTLNKARDLAAELVIKRHAN